MTKSRMSELMMELPQEVRRQLCTWAQAGYPFEACGLLLGRKGGRADLVTRANLARNAAGDRRRSYLLAPADFVSAWREADSLGLEILGIWHSHPDGSAEPSATDLRDAWNGYAYLIVSVTAQGVSDIRTWRLEEQTA